MDPIRSYSLNEIYVWINIHLKHGAGSRFRVRDLTDLKDYAITRIKEYGAPGGMAKAYDAIQLDNCMISTFLVANERKYGLLSTLTEVNYLSTIHSSFFESILAGSYRESHLAILDKKYDPTF